MYLEKLVIKNFRAIEELEIYFNKELNIIVGENNAGKSAIIDALRICFSYGKQWRDIGIRNDEDFFIDLSEIKDTLNPIEFHLFFKVESPEDRHYFNSMVVQNANNPDEQTIQMHFKYSLDVLENGNKNLRWTTWGGEIEGQQIKAEEAQLIYYTYLAALRNAEQELRPYSKDNKVTSLFKDLTKYTTQGAAGQSEKTLTKEVKLALAAKLENVIQDEDWLGLIKTGEKLVNEHLEEADISTKESKIHLRLLEYKYENIVKGILTRKPVYKDSLLTGENANKQRFFDVSQNGLGENNLIYASTVLGDLKNRREEKKEHYYALLIEEPEAHLHPQKQNTFFKYLNNLKNLGVQVFITSHSPTITAKSNPDNLLVLQKQQNKVSSFALKNSELSKQNKQYLSKFLDVTKSQLFFSNGSILVEGISEALLLPIFARMTDHTLDLNKNGIEIVNVNGIAFEPFAKLYNSGDPQKRLPSKCSILTDNDKGLISPLQFVNSDNGITKQISIGIYNKLKLNGIIDNSNRVSYQEGTQLNLDDLNAHSDFVGQTLAPLVTKISSRAQNAISLTSGNLKVEAADITFEYELMIADNYNFQVIEQIYKQIHPRLTISDIGIPLNIRALNLLNKINNNKDKSELAQRLAHTLENRVVLRSNFKIPTYIQRAIKWIVSGE